MTMAQVEFGYDYQNDHNYPFYIALCYLQLNEFEKARQTLQTDFEKTTKEKGENSIHYLDLFYKGIIQYELRNYDNAIIYFDKSLFVYKNFSAVQFYVGICLLKKGDTTNAKALMYEAKGNFEKGYTINEDDSFYESYPYKVNWHICKWSIPGYKE
jgi:tetratricopeptide (TPR) repeat protein